MSRVTWIAIGGLGAVLVVAFGIWLASGTDAPATNVRMPENVDVAQGEAVYAAQCASCHGADLEGQPNWQTPGPDGVLPAPPHDDSGHTWHHPDSMLFDYTKFGGEEAAARMGLEGVVSGMPGFGDVLSDQDIWNVLAFIKSHWSARNQELQAQRTP